MHPPPSGTSYYFINLVALESTDFKWDPDCCAQNITLADENRSCFLMEGGYCFRTVLATIGFTSGVHYWEIHADSRTENELKIGIANKKNFNLNTVRCCFITLGIL